MSASGLTALLRPSWRDIQSARRLVVNRSLSGLRIGDCAAAHARMGGVLRRLRIGAKRLRRPQFDCKTLIVNQLRTLLSLEGRRRWYLFCCTDWLSVMRPPMNILARIGVSGAGGDLLDRREQV